MEFKKAKHIKVGEFILIDVGYDNSHEVYCEVLEINPKAKNVFDKVGISFLVKDGNEYFWTHLYHPRQFINFKKDNNGPIYERL